MKNTMLYVFFFFILSCKETTKEIPVSVEKDEAIEELVFSMTGSFSSEIQAEKDSAYLAILLHLYPIWKEKEGNWLYLEQAEIDKQDAPFRQSIFKVSRENDSIFKSEEFIIPNESLWICKWQTPVFFDKLLLESLVAKTGCDIFYTKTGTSTYNGKTKGKKCMSRINAEVYTTTEMEITGSKIMYRERGFNAKDTLVWGKTTQGYEFIRISN